MSAIIAYGNVADGFSFTGPFPDHDTAANACDGHAEAWIATLDAPELDNDDQQADATILAALRFYQAALAAGEPIGQDIKDIADNGDTVIPLSVEEIDTLCEDLNMNNLWLVRS